MSYSENFDLENAIQETEFYLLQQYASIETVKSTVRDIMSSAGLIIALFGLLQISFDNINIVAPGCKEYLLLSAIGLYIIMFGVGVFLLMPTTMHTPMEIEKKTFEKLFYNKEPKRILENKLTAYLEAINKNRSIETKASALSKIFGFSYMAIVILIIASLFI